MIKLAAVALFTTAWLAEAPAQLHAQIPQAADLAAQLRARDLHTRRTAAQEVLRHRHWLDSAGVSMALVDLLELENDVITESFERGVGVSNEYGEGYGEYYSALLRAVLTTADIGDDRVLRVLLLGAYNPDAPFVAQIVTVAGARVVPVATQLLRGPVPDRQNGLALLALVYETRSHELTPQAAQEIKRLIMRATEDRLLIQQAVAILGRIGTRADLPLLTRIAETDSYARMHDRKGRIYPVRIAAYEAMRSIRRRP